MLYLEDYLEMIEHLPQELRDRFTEMRELDLAVQNNMDSLEKKTRCFFQQRKRGELQAEAAENEYQNLRNEYYKVLEDADEKVVIATQIHELVDRYVRRLDSELFKFKCELEADNHGITEILEKRSLELEGNSTAATALVNMMGTNQKENRHYASQMGSGAAVGASNNNPVSGVGLGALAPAAVAQPKDNRHRTTPRPEKRRDSTTSTLSGGQPEKRLNLGAVVTPTSPAVGSATPNVGTHAVLSAPAASVAAASGGGSIAYNLQQAVGGPATTHNNAATGSQTIVQQGRRASGLKATYEAVTATGGGPTEFWISRDIVNTQTASNNSVPSGEKKQKKKSSQSVASSAVSVSTPSSTSSTHSSSSSVSVDSVDTSTSSSTSAASVAGSGSGVVSSCTNSAGATTNNLVSTSAAAAAASVTNKAQVNENGLVVEQTPEGEWSYDPNEPRYCTCNQVSYGDMVACDNDACPFEWFHYPCVGITQPPKGKWYCPKCTASMRRRNRKN